MPHGEWDQSGCAPSNLFVAAVVYLSTDRFLQEWPCMCVGCSELMVVYFFRCPG